MDPTKVVPERKGSIDQESRRLFDEPSTTTPIDIESNTVEKEHTSQFLKQQIANELGIAGGNEYRGEDFLPVSAGLHEKFREDKTFGSRMIGGKEPSNWIKYSAYESTSYIEPDTIQREREFLKMTPKSTRQRRLMLWFRYALSGSLVSIVIYLALKICGIIEYARVKQTKKYLNKGDTSSAWAFWTLTSLGMTMFSCLLVLLQPAAASSGIPGLIAFLNGVEPAGGQSPITKMNTKWTSLRTMGAKFVGMLTSIPSGLCVGPEGPIIHISSLVSLWSTHLVHAIEEKLYGKEFDVTSAAELRDFLATGAGCGITTAFRAPLAGTMFVVEEAGSFFTTQHLEYTFFSCLMAYWFQWVLGYTFDGEAATQPKFQQDTGYFCNVDNPLNMVAYMIIAVIGGGVGALFNQIVEKLNHLRAHHINKSGIKRMLEIIFITLLTGTVVVFLPMSSNCRLATRDIMLRDSAGCLPADDFAQVSNGEIYYNYMKSLSDQTKNCTINSSFFSNGSRVGNADTSSVTTLPVANVGTMHHKVDTIRVVKEHLNVKHFDTLMIDNDKQYIHPHYEHVYICGEDSHTFNDMAMLWLNGGVKGVKVLLQRGFPHLISEKTLFVFFIVYFILAAITAGTSVPAGLVVPMLLIGGSMGRLFGYEWMKFKTTLCNNYVNLEEDPTSPGRFDMYYWAATYRWIVRDCKLPDPGTFACIGMASFMGGSGRITVMLAIVMLELTGDAGMIAPVGIVCIIAMIVGNMFNHGLYHGLIPLMNIPFLNSVPAQVMYVTRVNTIMSSTLVTLPVMACFKEIQVLYSRMKKGSLSHSAFPVVESENDLHLLGLLDINHIELMMKDMKDPKVKADLIDKNGKIDLMNYCDRSPLAVTAMTTVARAYEMFRKLGLRHLMVLGGRGQVVGVITRKDLMVFRIIYRKRRELDLVVKMQRMLRQILNNQSWYENGSGTTRSEIKEQYKIGETIINWDHEIKEFN